MSRVEDRHPGIDILLELAEKGEIDPWDIDLIKVTDRYLKALERRDLPLPAFGRALYYAACLLRMKASILAGRAQADAGRTEEGAVLGGEGPADGGEDPEPGSPRRRSRVLYGVPDPFPFILERPRDRRLVRPGITLTDLLAALRGAEDRLRERAEEEAQDDLGFPGAAETALETSHTDDVEGDCSTVRSLLDAMLGPDARVEMRDLILAGLSPVMVYMALLELSFLGEVVLVQEEFYGALYVGRGEPEAVAEPPPSVRDEAALPRTEPLPSFPESDAA